ncbi:ead/Ea22-like family protein [Enterobacter hormaechei]|uniref:ead/Ea22-like family protein n=1 Tax=Enterobacter hormaechei TaxID=158836 RepID=UPI003DA724F8
MSIKNLVEMIKHNGLLSSMSQLEKLYQAAIENEQKLAELEAHLAALAAENAGLKNALEWLYETVSSESVSVPDEKYSSVTNAAQVLSETPATSAFLAEVRARAHKEGAYFVANRMLAAWDAGFIDDTAKNAADIARMILTSTEFMAGAPVDDFDRSFADGVLEDIAAQLRKGVQS